MEEEQIKVKYIYNCPNKKCGQIVFKSAYFIREIVCKCPYCGELIDGFGFENIAESKTENK